MKVRECTLADYETIMAIRERNGLGRMGYEEWGYLWEDNPFHAAGENDPIGWLLHDESVGPVGYYGSIRLAYELDGRPISAAAGHAWAVDKDFRYCAVNLLSAFLGQNDIQLFLNNTAGLAAFKVCALYGMRVVPGTDHGENYRWIAGYLGAATEYFRRKGIPGGKSLALPAALSKWLQEWARRRRWYSQKRKRVELLPGFDGRFDAFWEKLRALGHRLLVVRTQNALGWFFRRALRRATLRILAIMLETEILGYILLLPSQLQQGAIRFKELEIVDLQVLDDDPDLMGELIVGALELARKERVHVLSYTQQMGRAKRATIEQFGYSRKLPDAKPPFLYQSNDADLVQVLDEESVWDPSPADGDMWLDRFQ
jgi:hypothetical protein